MLIKGEEAGLKMILTKGSKGSQVEELQTLLKNKGFNPGPVDGSFGPKTLAAVMAFKHARGLPESNPQVDDTVWFELGKAEITDRKLYDVKVIECNEITVFESKGKYSCSNFMNSTCGTFTYPSGKNVCSILVSNGETLGSYSCHYWPAQGNHPETVLYELKDGTRGAKRCKTSSELPTGVKWAIGGMGLLSMYNPGLEGFIGKYADVRNTNDHNVVLIMPGGRVLLALCENMNANQINAWAKRVGATYGIIVDGGHLAAINSPQFKKRVKTPQGVIVQGVR